MLPGAALTGVSGTRARSKNTVSGPGARPGRMEQTAAVHEMCLCMSVWSSCATYGAKARRSRDSVQPGAQCNCARCILPQCNCGRSVWGPELWTQYEGDESP